ncbi:SDR family oxidoreductase [Microlunatus elymi]|uniref:SDR family oxidoreductase n=2 Tax=Microlunatus elymi TaxID=2596828 RepID=A0A516Q4X4_9ACTN|nr:SDR family oxidoreductase [Microlunatus elymi]
MVQQTTLEHDLIGTVALIAGGSKGIGADAARAFAAAGAAVVIGARDQPLLQKLAAEISEAGGRAVGVRSDVTVAEDCQALVDTAVEQFGRLDFAFNNATGGHRPALLADITLEEFDREIATNVRGTFLGMKAQIPAMLKSGGGAIVNMASVAGLTATARLAPYVAGKAGIIGLSRVAALDYADQGIRVNAIAPGPIRTHHIESAGERAQQLAAQSVPIQRMGAPAEVSEVVLWLCSSAASYVTGAVIPIDGGQSAGLRPSRNYEPGKPMD